MSVDACILFQVIFIERLGTLVEQRSGMSKRTRTTPFDKKIQRGQQCKATTMPVRVTGCGRKLNKGRFEKDLDRLGGGTVLSLSCPEDYRRFMIKYNGGEPEPNYFVVKGKDPKLDWVDAFHPISGSKMDPLNLQGANQILGERAIHWGVPYDCITVGIAGGGPEDILLFVRGRRRGQVWLKVWDDVYAGPEHNRDTDPNEGLYFLAKSFNEFLAMLCTEEEAEQRALERRERDSAIRR